MPRSRARSPCTVAGVAVVRGGDVAQSYRFDLDRRPARVREDAPEPARRVLHHRGRRACAGWANPRPWWCPRCWRSPTATPTGRRSSRLEWIDIGEAPERHGDASSAASLAALHRAAPARFGREDRRTTGSRGPPERALRDLGRVLRHATHGSARPAGARRPRAAGRAIAGLERLGRPARGWRRSAAAMSRRPACMATCGPATAWSTPAGTLADRPCGPRRTPRVRPGDDAALRRLRRRLLRRLRRGRTRSPSAGRTGCRCTRSRRSWSTPSSSVAATSTAAEAAIAHYA